MEDEKNEPNEEPTTDNSEDVDADEFDDEETSRDLVVPGEILTEDTKNYLRDVELYSIKIDLRLFP